MDSRDVNAVQTNMHAKRTYAPHQLQTQTCHTVTHWYDTTNQYHIFLICIMPSERKTKSWFTEPKKGQLTLVKHVGEFIPTSEAKHIPKNLFGIYVLYLHRKITNKYDVQYIGTANHKNGKNIKAALNDHIDKEQPLWTHVSTYELWDTIGNDDQHHIEELFKHIYRKDSKNRIHVSKHKKQETDETSYMPREMFSDFVKSHTP